MQAWHQFTAAIAIDSSKLLWKQNRLHHCYNHDHQHPHHSCHPNSVVTNLISIYISINQSFVDILYTNHWQQEIRKSNGFFLIDGRLVIALGL